MDNNMIQIMIGIGQIIAVAVIPIIVWVLGIKYQDRNISHFCGFALSCSLNKAQNYCFFFKSY